MPDLAIGLAGRCSRTRSLTLLAYLVGIVVLAIALSAWLGGALLRPKLFALRVQRVMKEFARDRQALQSKFFQDASQSGKPRGLAWKQCAFQEALTLGRDRANGEIIGLVGVTISFEAIEGGGMEDVEAVGNLRAATAVFAHNGRAWTTQGKAIFNLEPREVLERYQESLAAISSQGQITR